MNKNKRLQPVLSVKNLSIDYSTITNFKRHVTHAVKDVSFDVFPGDCFALVGESGCGKTSIINAVLRFIRPKSGSLYFNNRNLIELSAKELQKIRPLMQPVFQDFHQALNPRIRIRDILQESLSVVQNTGTSATRLLSSVGLNKDIIDNYPHQLSGGQKQRIALARALSTNPILLMLDEPTTSLDISVAVQIMKLLKSLQESQNLTFILVSHNLAIVRLLASRIAIMKNGCILEEQPTEQLFSRPKHSYTISLLRQVIK